MWIRSFFCTSRQPLTTPIFFFRPSCSGIPASRAAWLMKVMLVAWRLPAKLANIGR
ncbi:hypothetical protein D3C81_2293400 [compost metagenome]